MSSNNHSVFKAFLDNFTAGDHNGFSEYLTEDFSFHGPMMQASGKQAFLDGLNPDLFHIMRGYTMLRQFEDGDEICSIYDMHIETPAAKGSVSFVEWNRVEDGKLATSRVIFDTGAFMSLMPS